MTRKYKLEASEPIGVFDSGIGGTTILKSVRELLPNENYVFFGDSANCPFGTKSLKELKQIVTRDVEYLLERKVKLIIVACNTATTQTIEYLRRKYPFIEFIGTEPAVKLACDSGCSRIILLSTEGTAHSLRTEELIRNNIHVGQEIINLPCLGLAEAIETQDEAIIQKCLEKNLKSVKEPEKVEIVILGCTHYPLAKDEIQTFFPNARLIDGGNGVARRTRKILEERKLINPAAEMGEVQFFFSKGRK